MDKIQKIVFIVKHQQKFLIISIVGSIQQKLILRSTFKVKSKKTGNFLNNVFAIQITSTFLLLPERNQCQKEFNICHTSISNIPNQKDLFVSVVFDFFSAINMTLEEKHLPWELDHKILKWVQDSIYTSLWTAETFLEQR